MVHLRGRGLDVKDVGHDCSEKVQPVSGSLHWHNSRHGSERLGVRGQEGAGDEVIL